MDNPARLLLQSYLHTRRADRAALSRGRRERVGAGWLNAEESAAFNRTIPPQVGQPQGLNV